MKVILHSALLECALCLTLNYALSLFSEDTSCKKKPRNMLLAANNDVGV